MGGNVTVVIRESSGIEHRMQRWTNSMPWGICNVKMMNEDRTHLDEYLKQWFEMKDDWEKNKDTQQFQFPMTSVYFPSIGFAPQEYGFVCLDFKSKTLISYQEYTSLNKMYMSAHRASDEDEVQRLQDLIKAGAAKTYCYFDRDKGDMVDDVGLPAWLLEHPSNQNIRKFIEEYKNTVFEININWHPFRLFDFKRGEIKDAYQKVQELDFIFNDEERVIWEEWIKDIERDYGDEDG